MFSPNEDINILLAWHTLNNYSTSVLGINMIETQLENVLIPDEIHISIK